MGSSCPSGLRPRTTQISLKPQFSTAQQTAGRPYVVPPPSDLAAEHSVAVTPTFDHVDRLADVGVAARGVEVACALIAVPRCQPQRGQTRGPGDVLRRGQQTLSHLHTLEGRLHVQTDQLGAGARGAGAWRSEGIDLPNPMSAVSISASTK